MTTQQQRRVAPAPNLAGPHSAWRAALAEQRQAEATLRASEEQWRRAFDAAGSGEAWVGTTGRWLRVNPALCELFGYSAAELLTMRVRDTIHPDDLAADVEMARALLAGECTSLQREARHYHKQGALVWVLVTASLGRDAQGAPLHFIAQVQDITERKHAEEQLRESEERFRSTFASSGIGMALVGLDGHYLQVNPAMCALLGYSAATLMGYRFQDITHPGDLEADLAYNYQLLAGAIPSYQLEKRYYHQAGHIIWVLLSGSLVRDAQGAPLYFIAQVLDITAHKQAVEQLEQQAAQLRAQTQLLDLTPDAILTRGLDGRISFWNQGAAQLYGWADGDAQGQVAATLLQTAFPESAAAVEQALLQTGAWEGELAQTTRDGRHLIVLSCQAVQRTAAGDICAILEVNRDITKRKQQEERARAAERLGALARVATGVAHEFNNALAGIMGWLDLLALDMQEPEQLERVRLILQATEDAAAAVRRVQTFTRLRDRGAYEMLDLNQLVAEVVQTTQARWPSRRDAGAGGITVQTQVEPGLQVPGSSTELREVLTNLVFNAADALPHGGEITIRAYLRNGAAQIVIQDTGRGMDLATQEQIFEPFFTTKTTGSGLGLAVVRDIVESHGGTISVASTPGIGTTFTLILPAETAPAAPAAQPAPGAARILVLDDDGPQAAVLCDLLEMLGHVVTTAGSEPEALALVQARPFDLVCLEPGLSGLHGAAVVRQGRALAPSLALVLITGGGRPLDPAALAARTGDPVLVKPYRLGEVQQAVAHALAAAAP